VGYLGGGPGWRALSSNFYRLDLRKAWGAAIPLSTRNRLGAQPRGADPPI
jgi:hypothetical protein